MDGLAAKQWCKIKSRQIRLTSTQSLPQRRQVRIGVCACVQISEYCANFRFFLNSRKNVNNNATVPFEIRVVLLQ